PCREDAVSLQGAVGPAGDGSREPGVHELHQDAAVCLSLARQQQGSSHGGSQGHDPTWAVPLLWVQPSPGSASACPRGLRLLHPARTTNRILCESNSSLRSALLLSSQADLGAQVSDGGWRGSTNCRSPFLSTALQHRSQGDDSLRRPLPAAASWADRDLGHSGASLGQQWSSASSTDTASLLSSASSCSSEDGLPSSPHQGTKPSDRQGRGTPCCSARHFSKRKLPAFAPEVTSNSPSEPMSPCPMYRLVLAGDTGTGKSSFLLRLCMNEFRGDISGTLPPPSTPGTQARAEAQEQHFQIKQLLVDGEQTTLQIWDTAGQER
ncbi:Ras and EF-hand domain-containing protein, partial [Eudyptes schlegeli]